MKLSLNISKYLSISKKFSPKDWFFQQPQMRVPLQNILICAHSERYIPAGSYGTGILAGNPNQTHFRFWSGVTLTIAPGTASSIAPKSIESHPRTCAFCDLCCCRLIHVDPLIIQPISESH